MPRPDSPSLNLTIQRGPLLIGLGLTVVLLAQVWPPVPIAAALALIGWGATDTCLQNFGSRSLAAANLLVYSTLIALAAGAELHRDAGSLTLLDVAAAVAIFVGTARAACR